MQDKADQYDRLRASGKTHQEAVDEIEGVSSISRSIAPGAILGEFSKSHQRDAASRTMRGKAKAVGGAVRDLGRTVAQGVPIVGPWTDEAIGSVRGALTPGMTMAEGRAKEANAVRGIRKENSFALPVELATGITSGNALLKSGKLPGLVQKALSGVSGGRVLPRLAANTVLGASAGAVSGAGAAESGDRAGGAKVGGIVGGLASAVIPEVVGGATKLSGKIKQWREKRTPAAIAGSMLGRSAEADMTDLAGAAQRAKPDERLLDIAGPFTRKTLAQSTSSPSEEATLTRRFFSGRAEGVGRKAAPELARATGVERSSGNLRAGQDIEEAFRPDISKAYKAVMGKHETLIDPRLVAMLEDENPIIKAAIGHARQTMAEAGKPMFKNYKGETIDQGLEFFDQMKRAIDKQAKTANKTDAMNAGVMSRKLRDVLDELTGGEYKVARELDQTRIAYQNATQLGEKVARSAKDVRDTDLMLDRVLKNVKSPQVRSDARVAFREGVARELVNQLDNAGEDASALTKFFRSTGAERKARLAFPDDRTFDAFSSKSKELLKPLLVAEAGAGNAQAARFLEPDTFERLTPWALSQALHGNPALAAAQALSSAEAKQFSKQEELAQPLLAKYARTPVASKEFGQIAATANRWSPKGVEQQARDLAARVSAKRSSSGLKTRIGTQALLSRMLGQ